MTVYESELPGVGKKFEIELGDEERLVIITHNTGKREIYRRASVDEDSEKLFELSDKLARQIGTILEGAYFQPIATDTTETMLDENTLIEWVSVVDGSDLVGQTLQALDFRNETGASIVAVRRGSETLSNPGPETVIQAEDTLIVLGTRQACQSVESLASGTAESVDPDDVEDDA